MPSIITHAVVGLVGGRLATPRPMPRRFWITTAVLAALPDADVVALSFGIPYGDPLGHRGLTHGLPFAAAVGLGAAWLLCRGAASLGALSRTRAALWLGLITASHGVLDAFTDGGRGIGFLVPLWNERYFWPWRPVEVAPIGVGAFFSARGAEVMWSEVVWIWVPLLALLAAVETVRRSRAAAISASIRSVARRAERADPE